MNRILTSVNYSIQSLKKMRIKVISSGFFFGIMERPKQLKSTEAVAAHYSLRLGFLKRNLWSRTHISSIYLYTNLPLKHVISFKIRWMVRFNHFSFVRKSTLSAVSNPQVLLEAWARMGRSDLLQYGMCLFPIILQVFHCAPRNNQISYPLLALQFLS